MIHVRDDYNRIQDPASADASLLPEGGTPIGEDEPVFLLRAKDKHFYAVLKYYWCRVYEDDAVRPEIHDDYTRAVSAHIDRGLAWQARNGCKSPDLGEDV